MTGPQEAALAEAVRKARRKADRAAINAKEQKRIIDMMKAMPITQVKEQTGRSYFTLLRIAQVAL